METSVTSVADGLQWRRKVAAQAKSEVRHEIVMSFKKQSDECNGIWVHDLEWRKGDSQYGTARMYGTHSMMTEVGISFQLNFRLA